MLALSLILGLHAAYISSAAPTLQREQKRSIGPIESLEANFYRYLEARDANESNTVQMCLRLTLPDTNEGPRTPSIVELIPCNADGQASTPPASCSAHDSSAGDPGAKGSGHPHESSTGNTASDSKHGGAHFHDSPKPQDRSKSQDASGLPPGSSSSSSGPQTSSGSVGSNAGQSDASHAQSDNGAGSGSSSANGGNGAGPGSSSTGGDDGAGSGSSSTDGDDGDGQFSPGTVHAVHPPEHTSGGDGDKPPFEVKLAGAIGDVPSLAPGDADGVFTPGTIHLVHPPMQGSGDGAGNLIEVKASVTKSPVTGGPNTGTPADDATNSATSLNLDAAVPKSGPQESEPQPQPPAGAPDCGLDGGADIAACAKLDAGQGSSDGQTSAAPQQKAAAPSTDSMSAPNVADAQPASGCGLDSSADASLCVTSAGSTN